MRQTATYSIIIIWLTTYVGVAKCAEPVDYRAEVKPLLQRCFACHGALRQQAGLRLDAVQLIRIGGDSGPAVIAGKADESPLVEALAGANGRSAMPPEGSGTPLSFAEIQRIKDWVNQGAQFADEPIPEDPRQHWSFRKLHRPEIPQIVPGEWIRNPVDAFLAIEHQRNGLTPAPETHKGTLLRRVYLDLIGVPPTRQELNDFLADTSSDAYDKVVQRLLSSSPYGERWGRHWMDVWRYSDWAGYGSEIRESQYHIWRWRDWIVESLNADRPYDEMVIEMLAGDELAPHDPNTLRATGYLGRNWFKFNRNVWLDNTVEHMGKAFLGLTLNCARCHEHKYDPLEQVDYYHFRAIFEPHSVRTDRLSGQADITKDGVSRVYDEQVGAATYVFARGDEAQPIKEQPVAPKLPAFLGGDAVQILPVALPVHSYYPALQDSLIDEVLTAARSDVTAAELGLTKAVTEVEAARKRRDELAATPNPPTASEPAPNKAAVVFLTDDFAKPQPEAWKSDGGDWQWEGGHLLQRQIANQFQQQVSQQDHPPDFQARMRFKATGGNLYKSVGMSFNIENEQNFQAVYLSAHEPGPKLQVFYRKGGTDSYPAQATVALPIRAGEEYVLEISVRGDLLNASVNGELKLAYELPSSRVAGKFSIWTYDATAEFYELRITSLASDAKLAGATNVSPGSKSSDVSIDGDKLVSRAESAAVVADKKVASARAALASLESRVSAERVKYGLDKDGDLNALTTVAVKAERAATLLTAEYAVTDAEHQLSIAKHADKPTEAKAKKAIEDSQAKLDTARKALSKVHEEQKAETSNYSSIGPVYPSTSTGRRLALARWIANRENPLTARVAINHIWSRHFGTPLVPTVFDFGVNGSPPANPALLDWLATELIRQEWRMKEIHRLLVTSNAYRMRSASPNSANQTKDPDNRFLWRMNIRRLEAEAVRDSVLHVGGALDSRMGGPEIDENSGEKSLRRSIYFRHAKEKQMVFLKLFDGPGVSECYRRDETVVPQQALALANSSLAKTQARRIARQLSAETGTAANDESLSQFVNLSYEQILSRPPTALEFDACREFLASQTGLLAEKHKLTAAKVGDTSSEAPSADPRQRAKENLVHVLLNHSDFVTIH